MRFIALLMLLLIPAVAAQAATVLEDQVAAAAARAGGRMGIAAILVESGRKLSVHGDDVFYMASTVKVPVAVHVLILVEEGRLKLDQKETLLASDIAPGVSKLRGRLKAGNVFTIRELLTDMIEDSDNTACDMLLRLSGGAAAVTKHMREQGLASFDAGGTEGELAKEYDAAPQKFLDAHRAGVSPMDMARLLVRLETGKLLRPETTQVLRGLMVGAKTGPERIKGKLPAGTPVEHKTGTGGDRAGVNAATNDIGIITLPSGRHIALAVYNSGSDKDMKAREAAIAAVARLVYDAWLRE
jgi:beta-lactamase class A